MSAELDRVVRDLNREIRKITERTVAGLLAGGLLIQRDAQQHVPVEYGNLRASAYTRKMPENPKAVEIGFTASYALFVHENLEMKWKGRERRSGIGVYWGPSGEARFLANAIQRQRRNVLAVIRAYGSGERTT